MGSSAGLARLRQDILSKVRYCQDGQQAPLPGASTVSYTSVVEFLRQACHILGVRRRLVKFQHARTPQLYTYQACFSNPTAKVFDVHFTVRRAAAMSSFPCSHERRCCDHPSTATVRQAGLGQTQKKPYREGTMIGISACYTFCSVHKERRRGARCCVH
jgi:hypothetical protein